MFMSASLKKSAFWVVIICAALLLWTVYKQEPAPPGPTIAWSRFSEEAKNGNIAEITVADDLVTGTFKNGTPFKTVAAPFYRDTVERLMEQGVSVRFLQKAGPTSTSVLINAMPFVFLLAFWMFMMRRITKTKKESPPS
jgi:cell division protease FtsH